MMSDEELKLALEAALCAEDGAAPEESHCYRDEASVAFKVLRVSGRPAPVVEEDVVEVLKSVTASLAAAISLLERGAKKAAASDTMFDMMLDDYRTSLKAARIWFNGTGATR